jgi:hypothetical protein
MKENFDDDMEEFKAFMPSPWKDRAMIAGIVILGVAVFIGIVFGSMYLAHEASNAVIQGMGLPPIK